DSTVQVNQSPSSIIVAQMKSVEINCQQSTSNAYMYWYRQKGTRGLQLVIFSPFMSSPEYGDNIPKRFNITRTDMTKITLKIENVQMSDTGFYLCFFGNLSALCSDIRYFGPGTKVTVLQQNVSLPHVKILEPVPYKSNEFVTLVCLATDFYPDHIELTWEINKKKTTDNAKSDYRAVQSKSKTYSISSRLRVSRNVWCNADNVFTCVAKFYNETDKAIYITDHVSGKGKDSTLIRRPFNVEVHSYFYLQPLILE
uniref:Ig-like domain-containing protein n=1 Tax=Erpetoichthys calabaricus TaxID=27687 RepID=A0A8C4X5Q0_ERPCA